MSARRPRSPRAERGSVTAEFAVAMPAAMLVVAIVFAGASAAAASVRLQDAAADAARSLARGDDAALAADIVRRAHPDARISRSTGSGGLVCVAVRAPAGPVLPGVEISGQSCALG